MQLADLLFELSPCPFAGISAIRTGWAWASSTMPSVRRASSTSSGPLAAYLCSVPALGTYDGGKLDGSGRRTTWLVWTSGGFINDRVRINGLHSAGFSSIFLVKVATISFYFLLFPHPLLHLCHGCRFLPSTSLLPSLSSLPMFPRWYSRYSGRRKIGQRQLP